MCVHTVHCQIEAASSTVRVGSLLALVSWWGRVKLMVSLGVVHNCHHFHERTQRTLGGGGQGRSYVFLNVVYSDGNEIIAHVRRTSMTKNPLVRNSLLVLKLVT